MLYPGIYWISFEDSKIESKTSQKRPKKLPISESINMDKDLETLNNNVDRPQKKNITPKKIELPKLGQAIKCKLSNDRFKMEKTECHK